jgi:DNA topoisomerase-1
MRIARGEAISWHLAEELKLDKTKTKQLYFMKLQKRYFKSD